MQVLVRRMPGPYLGRLQSGPIADFTDDSTLPQDVQQLKDTVGTLQDTVAGQQKQLDDLRRGQAADLSDLEARLLARVDALEAKVQALPTPDNRVAADLQELKDDVAQKLADQDAKLADLPTRNTAADAGVSAQDFNKLKQSVADLETVRSSTFTGLLMTVSKVIDEVQALQDLVDRVAKQVASVPGAAPLQPRVVSPEAKAQADALNAARIAALKSVLPATQELTQRSIAELPPEQRAAVLKLAQDAGLKLLP